MVDKIVAVHFPKSGGASLRSQLLDLLGADILLDYSHDPLSVAALETADFPAGKRAVYGHFRPHRYASATAYWMTFLRHPVDNLISIYYYWQSIPKAAGDLHGLFLRERPTVLEFATYPGLRRLMSSTYFGGFDMGRFHFIGFHESRDADIARLAGDIGLPVSQDVYTNKTKDSAARRANEADLAVRKQLTDLLADDIAFYERMWRAKH